MPDTTTNTTPATEGGPVSLSPATESTQPIGTTGRNGGRKVPFNLFSVTPKIGSVGGKFVLSVRGKNFIEKGLKVLFSSSDGTKTVTATSIHFVSKSLLEVLVPDLHVLRNNAADPQKSLVKIKLASKDFCAKETRHLKVVDTCNIVRKCLKAKGHDGRCCSDEGPPIYARQEPMVLQGGHFSTALIGYRTKKNNRINDTPMGNLPSRPVAPGGRIGSSNMGYRTRNGYKKNSLPGPVGPPALALPQGGHFSTALVGYRTKKSKHINDVPVRPPPTNSMAIPGGRMNKANLGYRTKNGYKKNSLPGPVNPPSFPVAGGGHFSTALIGYRTRKIPQVNDVPVRPPPKRPHTPGGRIGTAMVGYRTKPAKKYKPITNKKHKPIELPLFGADTPGGHFNTHGKDRSAPIAKRPQSAPMYNVRGCGNRLLPGGHFNKSGAHKEMFRFTYLDERG